MYKRILVPLEHSPYDDAILEHVGKLARHSDASLVLMHVADGFVARTQQQLALRESEEMRLDRLYLEERCAELIARGLKAECVLAGGDPANEIVDAAEREGCDLIAMSTHGHKGIQDLLYGSVASDVRHRSTIPVLLVRGSGDGRPSGGTTAVPSE
jgi:nucleotide-binding universal stress UspA family protein